MISLIDLSDAPPYKKFNKFYKLALKKEQKNIEAISISSYDFKKNEPNCRFVNLKFIINDEWIFFSNYLSPKANEFDTNPNIAATFFWQNINCQIRIKAKICKTNYKFSDDYFNKRDKAKNILAITSKQSKIIASYDDFLDVYDKSMKSITNPSTRPEYWGGYSFKPYYFEFWQGHNDRINKREAYILEGTNWENFFLQP